MKQTKIFDQLYKYIVAFRGFDGILDIIFAFILYFFGSQGLSGWLLRVFNKEFIEDPNDFIANWLLNFAQTLSIDTQLFLVLYLVGNGLLKIILFISLWFKKYWLYLPVIMFLTIFIFYQMYRLIYNFSLLSLLLISIDIFIVFTVYIKYRSISNLVSSGTVVLK